jgi:NAD(P)-dependent dehydrogenase (short-subunit alcohol dehydrogenase family)
MRTAIVTGGSTGIGAAIARSLIDDGYRVISLQRRVAAFDHPNLTSISVDLLDPDACAVTAAEIARDFAVTHLIHNAGAIRANLIEATPPADLATLSQLHLGVPLILAQAVLPAMKAATFGRIVLISSRAALGLATRTAYSATKSGMVGMARTWAQELGAHGITVNIVAPGPIEATEMFHDVLPPGDPRIDTLAKSIPVRRLGTPSDVAHAVSFFADHKSGFITGQTLYVCGGASVGTLPI